MPSIPEQIGDLTSIKSRAKKAFDDTLYWQDVLDDAYGYFLPQRNLFNSDSKGSKKMDRIFDSTSLESIKLGASKLQENIAPTWSRWANFEISSETKRLLEASDGEVSEVDISENLQEQAEILFDVLNRSNFATQFYEFALDLLIGTATMMIDEGESDDSPIVFSTLPQIGMSYEEGPHGKIENHFNKYTVKARYVVRKWPGFAPSAALFDTMENNPETDINLTQALIFDPKGKEYWAVVWVDDEDQASWVSPFGESSPMLTARYSKTAGEIRGRGPALDVLADVRSLNKAKEFMLTKAAIDLSGIWTAVDDGVTNPYNIQVAPGVTIPVGSNNNENPSLRRLDTSGDLNLSLFVVNDLQDTIRRAFFSEIREPSDSVVSATQFAIESRDLAKRIGSAFGRIQTEALIPILNRVYYILQRRGMINNPIKIGGRDVNIKFTSPLARTQDAEDLLAVQQTVQFTLEAAGPEQVQMAFKVEDFGTWAAEKTGMPQELVRNPSEKAAIIQRGAEVAEAQMGDQQPQPTGEI